MPAKKKIRTKLLRPPFGPMRNTPKIVVDDDSGWTPLDLWLFLNGLSRLADDRGEALFGPGLTEHKDELFKMLSPADQAGAMEQMRSHELARALSVVRTQEARLEAH
jgi:hypothetical protein